MNFKKCFIGFCIGSLIFVNQAGVVGAAEHPRDENSITTVSIYRGTMITPFSNPNPTPE